MKKVNRYEFDGEAIEVPVCWDRHLRRYVEDCTAYCEQPGYTPAGRPVLLTFEDACPHAEMAGGAPPGIDCGTCRTTINFPAPCWAYAKTKSAERKSGAPAGAAQPQKARRKHDAKTR
ncbi:MAG: hypothetical protein ACLRPX_01740 [Ruthenibacterium sp.]